MKINLTIDKKQCKGCALCVDFCPKNALDIAEIGSVPVFARPENCIGCQRCATLCPERAVIITERQEDC